MGKQAIIYVLGLSMLLGYKMYNLNSTSLNATDSFTRFYSQTLAHNIALAGANIGTHLCLADTGYATNLIGRPFAGGTFDVRIIKSGDTTHVVSTSRVSQYSYNYRTGRWETELRDTVESILKKIYFSSYGYFSGGEINGYMSPYSNSVTGVNMWKITGDSLFGPAHTNGRWNLSGRPYFDSKVTASTSPNLSNFFAPPDPIYNGGNQWGITVGRPLPRLTELENGALSGGKLWTAASTGNQDIGLQFISDGSVRLRIPWNTGTTRDTTYSSVTALAPNKIIAVKGIDVRVWGTYKGIATILARTTGSSGNLKGNIWIQGDIVAASDPQFNSQSTDVLGLVAERMTYVTTTGISRNSSSQTKIQAAIYCHNGVFGVENYTSCGVVGRLNFFGSLTMNASTATGTVGGGVLTNGMLKSIRFDPRFSTQSPPSFPFADKSQVIAWWEN